MNRLPSIATITALVGVALGAAATSADPIAAARQQPRDSIQLKSTRLEAILDPDDALPYRFNMLDTGESFWGEDSGKKIAITIFRAAPRGFAAMEGRAASVEVTPTQADFRFDLAYEGQPAVSFVLRYALAEAGVQISLEQVKERDGYELIDLAMPISSR